MLMTLVLSCIFTNIPSHKTKLDNVLEVEDSGHIDRLECPNYNYKSWEDRGKIVGRSWEDRGKIEGRSREDRGKIGGRSREDRGKIEGRSRDYKNVGHFKTLSYFCVGTR